MRPRSLARHAPFLALAFALACASTSDDGAARAAEPEAFEPLFNGVDLSGWVDVNCAPSTWTVRDGMIVCSGVPTGVLRTERRYENFVLELDYRHLRPGGNAGLFVWSDPLTARGQPFTRSIEVQVMDGVETENYTSHGDVFSIHGARMTPFREHPAGWERCLPSEKRARPSPEWNHYRVTCQNGELRLEVNGAEVSGGREIRPREGYICLESEGSEVHFKDLRIRELPPSARTLPPEHRADLDRGFASLYDGVGLAGWKVEPAHEGHWTAKDWILDYDGQGADLWSEREYGDFELIADWRWTAEPVKSRVPLVLASGDVAKDEAGADRTVEIDDAGDSGIYLRGSSKSQVNIWCWPIGSGEVYGYRTDASMPAEVRAGVTPKSRADAPIGQWNRFHVTMVGDRLSVVLNGVLVIDRARLPGVAPRGRIALQHHGSPIQFANLYVREIPSAEAAALAR
jgi:hypothetical protein